MKKVTTVLLLVVAVSLGVWGARRMTRTEQQPQSSNNDILKDFGSTVPRPLYRYLRFLKKGKTSGDLELWDYQKVKEMSGLVNKSLPGDCLILLGTNKKWTDKLGKTVYILYSKIGYPDTLILASQEENGQIEVLPEDVSYLKFSSLY